MFAGARKVLESGFFRKEVLSMHSSFDSVMTQWLFSVFIYCLKTYLGDTAVYYFCIGVFLYIAFILCKITEVLNTRNRYVPAALIFALLCAFFFLIRPYIVTVALNLTEIYVLERFAKKNDRKVLYWMIPISILQINFHNALWITLTLINLCYVVDFAHREDKTAFKTILLFSILTIVAGFVNPYGVRYLTFIFTSLAALRPFVDLIEETKPSIGNDIAVVTFYIVSAGTILFSIIMSIKKKVFIPIRMKLLFFGFLVLAVMARRNIILLYADGLIGLIFLFNYLPELLPKKVVYYSAGILTFTFLATAIICIRLDESRVRPVQRDINEAAEWFADYEPNRDVLIFDDFNSGSYLEYLGYKPYIDARAEVYGIANNHVKDVALEYRHILLDYSPDDIQRVIDEYHFDYCFCSKKAISEKIEALNYKELYRQGDVQIFDLRN